jgi:hypothetical protein
MIKIVAAPVFSAGAVNAQTRQTYLGCFGEQEPVCFSMTRRVTPYFVHLKREHWRACKWLHQTPDADNKMGDEICSLKGGRRHGTVKRLLTKGGHGCGYGVNSITCIFQ